MYCIFCARPFSFYNSSWSWSRLELRCFAVAAAESRLWKYFSFRFLHKYNIFHPALLQSSLSLSLSLRLSLSGKSSRFSYACHTRCLIFHCCRCLCCCCCCCSWSCCGIMLQFNRPRSIANISSCLRAGDGAEAAAAAALKFQQFDRRLRRMMIALIMSLGSGFGGADAGGGFATHVECLVQRDRRRSAAGYKLDAAHCRLRQRQRRRRQLWVPTATASGSTDILVLLMRKSFRFVGAAIKTSVKSKYCGKLCKVFLLLLKADLTLRVDGGKCT